ncbi:PIN domain-containing protein [Candidatus Woesearchaeota archaeon]|nr:PIN domain-containing protein [Candidatus Woesearchaeota archaeon]
MELVLDANILFSALIKSSSTQNLIFNLNCELYSPSYILDEFEKYETELLIKSGQKKEEFTKIFNMLKSIIKIVPEKEYFQFMKEAEKISPDFKDIHYFALALKLKCPIWSNDKRLKEQNQVKIVSTTELLKEVNYE